MALQIIFNPLTSNFDFVGSSDTTFLPPVATEADLPLTDPDGAVRVVLATDRVYAFDLSTTKWYDSGMSVAAFSATADTKGVTLAPLTTGNVIQNQIVLHAADATNPGGVSTTTQEFSGNKDFQDDVLVRGIVKTGAVDSLTVGGTLSLGVADAAIVNIGSATSTTNFMGDVNVQNVTNLDVTDKLITTNDGGGIGSGSDSGIQVEENAVITGYVKTSADRASYRIKAPATAGDALITPGASGIVLDQSSHNPVTIGTGNGLSLSTQQISLALSSALTTGALSNTDYAYLDAKVDSVNGVTGNAVVLDTDDINEGTSNLYFTDERAQDAIGTILVDTASVDLVYNDGTPSITATVLPAGVDHDSLMNFVANEHIDHSTVSIATAASTSGLSGGGDLTTTRNLSVNIPGTTAETANDNADSLLIYDNSATALKSMTRANFLVGVAQASAGDIFETSFAGANNQVAAADVTGLVFGAGVRAFKALVSITLDATADLYESIEIHGIQKSGTYSISQTSVGDASGIVLSITNVGQVQYTSPNASGFVSLTMKFRATTLGV